MPDAWEEVALVTIIKFDASSPLTIQAAAMTETIEIDQPDYAGESIPDIAGGRAWKQSTQEDGKFVLDIYPIYIENKNGTVTSDKGLFDFFVGGTPATTEPRKTDVSWATGADRTRDKFCVSIMWTNDTTPTSAIASTAGSTDSLRFTALNCRMISHKPSFADGVLKVKCTFKFASLNYAGDVMMYRWESAVQTAMSQLFTNGTYDDFDSWT